MGHNDACNDTSESERNPAGSSFHIPSEDFQSSSVGEERERVSIGNDRSHDGKQV